MVFFLFGLCIAAAVSIALVSMVGGNSTTSRAMDERLQRRQARLDNAPHALKAVAPAAPAPAPAPAPVADAAA